MFAVKKIKQTRLFDLLKATKRHFATQLILSALFRLAVMLGLITHRTIFALMIKIDTVFAGPRQLKTIVVRRLNGILLYRGTDPFWSLDSYIKRREPI